MATKKDFSIGLDLGKDPIFSTIRDMASDGMNGVLANSVNRTSTWTKHEAEKRIRRELALPAGYLTGNGRLSVKRASYLKPKSTLTAIFRPTTLRTYALNVPAKYKDRTTPVVEIVPGRVKSVIGAFYVQIRGGRIFPAMRLEDFVSAFGPPKTKPFGGIVLLYGPSVSQHFSLTSENMEGEIISHLRSEVLSELKMKGLF